MQSSFIEKIKMQQSAMMQSSRSQSQESPRKKRGMENKLAKNGSQARNINEMDQQDSLMEAASINKLGAPELEVVQEYRKINPKKFAKPSIKNSSAVPGRRVRSKDGILD